MAKWATVGWIIKTCCRSFVCCVTLLSVILSVVTQPTQIQSTLSAASTLLWFTSLWLSSNCDLALPGDTRLSLRTMIRVCVWFPVGFLSCWATWSFLSILLDSVSQTPAGLADHVVSVSVQPKEHAQAQGNTTGPVKTRVHQRDGWKLLEHELKWIAGIPDRKRY